MTSNSQRLRPRTALPIELHGSLTEMTGALLAPPGWELTTLMPWVRFDDQYPIHRKVAGLSDAAFRLHTAAIFWCSRNKTNGFVPAEDLDQVCAQVRDPARFAAECVKRGAWHDAAYACAHETCLEPRDEPGWIVHDWMGYQPTSEESDAAKRKEQEKKSSGGKLGNHRRWHAARGVTEADCPWCEPAKPSESDRYPIGESDRSGIAPSRPVPSVVDVGNQSSDRNAREGPQRLRAVAALASQWAHVLDDDRLLNAVIRSIRARTGRDIGKPDARRIAADILGRAKRSVDDYVSYVTRAIEREKDPAGRWLDQPGTFQPGMFFAVADQKPLQDQHPARPAPGDSATCECGLPVANKRYHREVS